MYIYLQFLAESPYTYRVAAITINIDIIIAIYALYREMEYEINSNKFHVKNIIKNN